MKPQVPEDMQDNEDGEIPHHEVESAAHDLMRAEKHKANPKLMAKVHEHLNGQKQAIHSIQDLKNARNSMMKKATDPDELADKVKVIKQPK